MRGQRSPTDSKGLGLGSVSPTNILTKVAVKLSLGKLIHRLKNCDKMADQMWMLQLNSTIEEEFKKIWDMYPTNDLDIGVSDICHMSPKNCGTLSHRPKRNAQLILTLSSYVGVASVFLYGLWRDYSATEAINELQEKHNEVVRVLQSSIDKEVGLSRIGKQTIVKVEDLVLKSYDTMYKDLCQTQSSLNYQMFRYMILEAFDHLRRDISQSFSGKVSDLILTQNHLKELMRKNDMFVDTIYHHDPSSFFLLSESVFISSDKKEGVVLLYQNTIYLD